ncbi:hypothetical protein FB451DRAFT_1197069 [Mycena latifolia]|nr:hypothetical protein FB451DRAFT_1197069 [Mycena latifolia]
MRRTWWAAAEASGAAGGLIQPADVPGSPNPYLSPWIPTARHPRAQRTPKGANRVRRPAAPEKTNAKYFCAARDWTVERNSTFFRSALQAMNGGATKTCAASSKERNK